MPGAAASRDHDDQSSSVPVRAAWIRFPELTTEVLKQVYTRLTPNQYLYGSAKGTFRRELKVDESGFVLDYPGLWMAETRAGEETHE